MPRPNLTDRVLATLSTTYAPFGHIATERFPDEDPATVKKALDHLVVTGQVELAYGHGYRRIDAAPEPSTRFGWQDFEPDESTDAIPGKFVLTIGTVDEDDTLTGDELFVMVHRHTPDHPIDGPLAEAKRQRATALVNLLNEAADWIDGDADRYPLEAAQSVDIMASYVATILNPDD